MVLLLLCWMELLPGSLKLVKRFTICLRKNTIASYWKCGLTISHVLDGIVVQDLAGLPGVAPLPQQVPQGLIVHLNEGGLHGILPPRVAKLAGSFQDLQTTAFLQAASHK